MSREKTPSASLEVKRLEWGIDRDTFDEDGNFTNFTNEYIRNIKSPWFSIGQDDTESSWCLSLQAYVSDVTYSLCLVPAPQNPSSVNIKVKIGMIMKDGTESKVKHCQIFSGTSICGYREFLEYIPSDDDDDDRSYWRKNIEYEHNRELTIFCDLEMDRKIRASDFCLSQDLSRLFDSGKLTDFTLVVGEEELKVHRAVLASRSPVFGKMFQQETKEKKDGRVKIEDLDAVGMKGLLQFIYTGEVKNLEEIAVNVLPAANKYGVDELKVLCEKEICNKSTVKNALLDVKRFQWRIERDEITYMNMNDDEVWEGINSRSFSFGMDNTKTSWSLKLIDRDSNYGLHLVPACTNPSSVGIIVKVGVILKDGTEANVKHCKIFGTDVWGYPTFLNEDMRENANYFRKNKLTIFCDIQPDRKIKVSDLSLSQDLSRLFDFGKLADFTLVVRGEELEIHSAILASRSPVFEAMFEHHMKEKKYGRINIKDEDLDVVGMKGLLQFIYTGEVKNLEEIAVNVLPAANKYRVDELKALCEKEICNKLTVKDAANALKMADRYSAKYLRTGALQFIKKNSAEIEEEPGFYDWAKTNHKIFKDIVKTFAAKRANESTSEPKEKRIKLN